MYHPTCPVEHRGLHSKHRAVASHSEHSVMACLLHLQAARISATRTASPGTFRHWYLQNSPLASPWTRKHARLGRSNNCRPCHVDANVSVRCGTRMRSVVAMQGPGATHMTRANSSCRTSTLPSHVRPRRPFHLAWEVAPGVRLVVNSGFPAPLLGFAESCVPACQRWSCTTPPRALCTHCSASPPQLAMSMSVQLQDLVQVQVRVPALEVESAKRLHPPPTSKWRNAE